jgi:hypothetical protein
MNPICYRLSPNFPGKREFQERMGDGAATRLGGA